MLLGDVDGDGDIDPSLLIGVGNPLSNEGGITRLWLNTASGRLSMRPQNKCQTSL